MKKKISFKNPNTLRANAESSDHALDAWVKGNPLETPIVKPETKRLNLEISAVLHAKIKSSCAASGLSIKEKILELLEKEFK